MSNSFLKGFAFFLGAFEFFAAYTLLTTTISDKNPLAPGAFEHYPVKLLYGMYIVTLGLQRLTWATTRTTLLSWTAFIATHAVEAILWWGLAIHKLKAKSLAAISFADVVDIIKDTLTFSRPGGLMQAVLLLGVPGLVILFGILAFPGEKKKSKEQ